MRKATTQTIRPLIRQTLGQATDDEKKFLENNKKIITSYMDYIEKFLIQKPFIAETEQPTLADYSCYCELDQLEMSGAFEFTAYPKTAAWMERMKVWESMVFLSYCASFFLVILLYGCFVILVM